ncbi:MAG: NUDIX hydrolase N-terminal domain-containing protein [Erysipelotrichaceae bacterium]|jgi:8-oxo-dGTP diphosphatase|nr:NUDIX hydrolase N-terminal domain-containing protein [Erysipelotrichaceae bacterium]
MEKEFFDFILKVHATAKIGRKYSTDPYALDNYEELETISKTMLENFTKVSFDRPNYFKRDVYPTPNVSARAVIFNEQGEVLLVKEADDGTYSLPGGWCELGLSPKESILKEVREEAGYEVEITKFLGINTVKSLVSANALTEYALFFAGVIKKELSSKCHEISEVAFFKISSLPELSWKVTKEVTLKFINASIKNQVFFD